MSLTDVCSVGVCSLLTHAAHRPRLEGQTRGRADSTPLHSARPAVRPQHDGAATLHGNQ